MADITLLTLNVHSLKHKQKYITHLTKKHKPDFIFLQETNINKQYTAQRYTADMGFKHSIFSLGTYARGVAIIQTSDKYTITHQHTDREGRIAIARVEEETHKYTLVNIYAPAQNTDKPPFFEQLEELLHTTYKDDNLILGGDFNFTVDEADRKHTPGPSTHNQTTQHNNWLDNTINHFGLVDAYRSQNPSGRETTLAHVSSQATSRLDRFYVQKEGHIEKIVHIGETLEFTDHKAVLISISAFCGKQNTHKKSPHWKLNNSLLDNPLYTKHITTLIQNTIDTTDAQTDIGELWTLLKRSIKQQTIAIATHINKQRINKERQLKEKLNTSQEDTTETETILLQLQEILDHKYTGARKRCRQRGMTEGPNRAFLTIEQNIQKKRTINKIVDAQGATHEDNDNIADAFKIHFQNIYTSEATDETAQNETLKHCKHLNEEEKTSIDTPITLQDIEKATNSLQTDKTPGPDGLTAEFYKHFFPTLGPFLLALLTDAITKDKLPDMFNEAYITVLEKNKDDPTTLNNYRPISLLNTDYKILSKILVNKIQPHLHALLHKNQHCSTPGRNIDAMNHCIRDVITYADIKQAPLALLSIDQEKAFDRVDHSYLFKVLKENNVGDQMVKWVRLMYDKPSSRVLVNHTLSDPFPIDRSVRQGCPLSPILYTLSIEPLLEKIRADESIAGMVTPGGQDRLKLLAYADDTTFLTTKISDIHKIIRHFDGHGKASGSKINVKKSAIMGVGKWKNKADFPPELQLTKTLKICGIIWTAQPHTPHKKTWDAIIDKTNNIIDKHKNISMTIFGRAIIYNTLILPKIIYQATSTQPPQQFIQHINKITRNYIFKNTIKNIDTPH